MRRSGISAGAKSLARGSTFVNQGDGLKRTGGIDSRGRPSSSRHRGPGYKVWRSNIAGKQCACCSRPAVDGHHVIYAQHLRANARETFMWDLRNQLPLCRQCHDMHHRAQRRVPRELLRRENIAFARMLALGWLIEREYPARLEHAA
jgi:hypothetical protein